MVVVAGDVGRREIVSAKFDAVVFDLLTALIDSWTLWNDVAGSEEDGLSWRKENLRLTYGAGAYRDYETIVAEAAEAAGLSWNVARRLTERWSELAVVTNCSIRLGRAAARNVFAEFDVVMTAEDRLLQASQRALRAGACRTRYVARTHAFRRRVGCGHSRCVRARHASLLAQPYWPGARRRSRASLS